MGFYETSDQLKTTLQTLFDRVAKDGAAMQAVGKARLIIRINITSPDAAVIFNGRKTPPEVTYGTTALRPDLDITLSADTLHKVLLQETRLRAAIAAGQLAVKGPVWKSFVLEDLFRSAQALYPHVLSEK